MSTSIVRRVFLSSLGLALTFALAALVVAVPAAAVPAGPGEVGPLALGEAPEPPELLFEAPPGLEGKVEQLRRFDTGSLIEAMVLLGLEHKGAPIRVLVAPEGTQAAQRAPSWAAAYAFGSASLIVLIPNRLPAYPDSDLFQVLRHEIVHVLVARAAGRHDVPRWFNEGLAMVGAHEWRLEDRGRLVLAAFRRQQASMDQVSDGFAGGGSAASSAYVVSAAFVRYLLDEEGSDVAARILERVAAGDSFPLAVEGATGHRLGELEHRFWTHLDVWNRWVPFLTSSAFLWIFATVLFLAAAARRRAQDAEQRRLWEAEDAEVLAAAAALAAASPSETESSKTTTTAPIGGWIN